MPKGKQKPKGVRKVDTAKVGRTQARRERRAKLIADRKVRKPMPVEHKADGASFRPGREKKRYWKFGPPRAQEVAA